MMFKVLVIQLSDERSEYLINDRLSLHPELPKDMRFLGLDRPDRVPDSRTMWLFRERLTKVGAIGTLFARFDATLRVAGYIAMSGQIVDTTWFRRRGSGTRKPRKRRSGPAESGAVEAEAGQAPA